MKLKISFLTIIFIIVSLTFAYSTLRFYNLENENSITCISLQDDTQGYMVGDCGVRTSLISSKFSESISFLLISILLTALSWKSDLRKKD